MESPTRSGYIQASISCPDGSLSGMELVLPSVPMVGSILTIYSEETQCYHVLDVAQPDGPGGFVHMFLERL